MGVQNQSSITGSQDEQTGMIDRVMAVVYRLFPSLASRHMYRKLHLQVGETYAVVEVSMYPQHGIQCWTVFSEHPFRLSNLHGGDDGDAVTRDGEFFTSTITLPINVIPFIVAGQSEVTR